ncbi:MAG: phosphatidylglycerol lysyltransferase domain-containing protein [Candidatus Omnitrophota bacterium]
MPSEKPNLEPLGIENRRIFEEFLNHSPRNLSPYSFTNIFIWRKLFDIRWRIIRECLCVFFQNEQGIFMYLSPLGKSVGEEVVKECFSIMDGINQNRRFSRMENIEESEVSFFKNMGFTVSEKYPDYLYLRDDLVYLKGDRFKAQRASCNHFTKHNQYEYLAYNGQDKDACLTLAQAWAGERKKKVEDSFYRHLLDDNLLAQRELLAHFEGLGVMGRVIKVDGKICAYTFGYELNKNTFCILFEVSDLNYKGISAFIFRKFCEELTVYKYINTMDDSGLENLKAAKLSYHPRQLVSSYIVGYAPAQMV